MKTETIEIKRIETKQVTVKIVGGWRFNSQ